MTECMLSIIVLLASIACTRCTDAAMLQMAICNMLCLLVTIMSHAKKLNESRCHLGGNFDGSNELCIRWGVYMGTTGWILLNYQKWWKYGAVVIITIAKCNLLVYYYNYVMYGEHKHWEHESTESTFDFFCYVDCFVANKLYLCVTDRNFPYSRTTGWTATSLNKIQHMHYAAKCTGCLVHRLV